MAAPVNLKNYTSEALHRALAPLGVTPSLARRIQASVWRRGTLPFDRSDLSATLLQRVAAASHIPSLERLEQAVSPRDGFTRLLLRGDGPDVFESVGIPLYRGTPRARTVACVSSQAGCGMGCVFCRTGRLGWRRDLAAWEIADQVVGVAQAAASPVRGVVFMGMGEAFLNYEAALTAAQILSEPSGLAIAARAISFSTVGVVPAIRRFTAERQPYRLVVSLTSADAARRRRVMPAEAAYPLPELRAALGDYCAASGERVSLAWTLIAGFNTRPDDARQLAEWLGDLPARIDLIDVNDPDGHFVAPDEAERQTFHDALRRWVRAPVARRYSGGADIGAACGLLAGCRRTERV
ncbi:MAG: radical SAM protein [Lentisphaerae bacterium]|nr:radical SAM protein [Lentisphaerota bacterium]